MTIDDRVDPADPDAALKWLLDTVFRERRLEELAYVLTTGEWLEVKPGCVLERRGHDLAGHHSAWPRDAKFRVEVDAGCARVTSPIRYYSRDSFGSLIMNALDEFAGAYPGGDAEQTRFIRTLAAGTVRLPSLETDAFGPRDPDDPHGAMKIALDLMFTSRRFDELCAILVDGVETSGFGGDPGWSVSRRPAGPPMNHAIWGHNDWGAPPWPADTHYEAAVHPDYFGLTHATCFCDHPTFTAYVVALVDVQTRIHPKRHAAELRLLRLLASGWQMEVMSTVEASFAVSNRASVIVAPGMPRPGLGKPDRPRWKPRIGDMILLECPRKLVSLTMVSGFELVSPPHPSHIPIMLGHGLLREQIPAGTKLWVAYPPEPMA